MLSYRVISFFLYQEPILPRDGNVMIIFTLIERLTDSLLLNRVVSVALGIGELASVLDGG